MNWLLNGIPKAGMAGIGFLLMVILSGCATYHHQHLPFHQAIEQGNYDQAIEYLEKRPQMGRGKNKLLYYLELGSARHLAGQYNLSNDAYEQAYLYIEDFQKNYALDALSFITNPAVVPYPGEDFEKVQIHYFKAINFALEGNINDAIVECRRINIKLNEINDKYEVGKRNRYSVDAFAWYFMGILFDVAEEYNNAFICYRNSLEAYDSNYSINYGLQAPKQLKNALLSSAAKTGLVQEFDYYSRQFKVTHFDDTEPINSGNIVVFWNNGLGPVKTEDSINFHMTSGNIGFVNFSSEENNLFLPVPIGNHDSKGLKGLSFIRMALPRYKERQPVLSSANVSVNNQTFTLEPLQNIERIAFLNLEDRMGRELGTALLRVALKQIIERGVRKEDQTLGLMVSVINAVSEQADTRNWQTLPKTIYCCRLNLPAGENSIMFNGYTETGKAFSQTYPIHVEQGKTKFLIINTPRSKTH